MNVKKPEDPFRLICKTDITMNAIDPNHWNQETSRQARFKIHKDTKTILLRFRDKMSRAKDDKFSIKDYPLMNDYRDKIQLYIDLLSKYYKISDYCAIIAKLIPNGVIPPHRDKGAYFDKSHRIHIPLKTNKDVNFRIGRIMVNMELGSAYEINNTRCVHGVRNNSSADRHHLIFDLFEDLI